MNEHTYWDQTTFWDRFRYYLLVTDVRNSFSSSQSLEDAKAKVELQRSGQSGFKFSKDELKRAQVLYDSAFHPDSGQKMNVIGRMSSQVISGMTILGLMLQFYKTPFQVTAMQCFNQSFTSFVNYTNRNAAAPTTKKQALFSYLSATSTAVAVAVSMNIYSRRAPPLVARWVPFVAVAAANSVNVPLTRQSELLHGVVITNDEGEVLGKSKKCAQKGLAQVVISRITIACPGMILLPIVMERLNKRTWFKRLSWLHLPFQALGIGLCMSVTVPVGCALFPRKASMPITSLEPDLQSSIYQRYGNSIKTVYFNKGL